MKQGQHTETLVDSTKTSVTYWRLSVPLAVTAGSASDSVKDFSLHTTLEASQLRIGGWYCNDVAVL